MNHNIIVKGGTSVRLPTAGKYVDKDIIITATATDTDPVLQEKTVTPTTSQQNVTPDSGYDGLSKVTVNAMPTATQATPSITVSSGGLITARATQSAGYVAIGTKSATKQLTVQAGKTVTPTTSNQTAVASGRYTTGAITVKGDANLKAENIKSGVSIFGVAGSYAGSGGGGGASVETCTVTVTVPINIVRYGLTKYVNGTLVCESDSGYGESELTFNDVVKGSCLVIMSLGAEGFDEISATNCTLVSRILFDMEDMWILYFQVNG